jgi:hypothetical protein
MTKPMIEDELERQRLAFWDEELEKLKITLRSELTEMVRDQVRKMRARGLSDQQILDAFEQLNIAGDIKECWDTCLAVAEKHRDRATEH